jgi:hypothetical protein
VGPPLPRLPGEPVGLIATVIDVALFVLLLKIGRRLKAERKSGACHEKAHFDMRLPPKHTG